MNDRKRQNVVGSLKCMFKYKVTKDKAMLVSLSFVIFIFLMDMLARFFEMKYFNGNVSLTFEMIFRSPFYCMIVFFFIIHIESCLFSAELCYVFLSQ